MASIGDIWLRVLADANGFEADLIRQTGPSADKAGAALGTRLSAALGPSLAAGLQKAGASMKATGSQLSRDVTLPILAIGAAAVAVGKDFDTSMRQIVALTDVTAAEIGGVRTEILRLAAETGKMPNDLAQGFYFLASAGFTTAEALKVLNSTAKASAAGLGDTASISQVVGAAINAFGKENLTASDAVDQLLRAVKDGTAEAPDFAASLGQVLGTAGQVGSTFADTTAAIAAMTLKGINADEAATSLNQIFVTLLKTTPQAQEALASVGLSADGLRKELKDRGLLALLQTLSTAFAGNDEAAAAAFGNVRALRGVLALTGGDAAQVARVFDDVANGTANLQTAFEQTDGPARKLDKAMAEMQVSFIELSSDVLPLFVGGMQTAAGVVHGIVTAFEALPEPVRTSAAGFLALAAAVGPALVVLGAITSTAGKGISGIVKLTSAIGGLGSSTAKAAATAGKAIGTAMGTATATAAVATEGTEIAAGQAGVVTASTRAVQTAGTSLGALMGGALATGFGIAAIGGIGWVLNEIDKEVSKRAGIQVHMFSGSGPMAAVAALLSELQGQDKTQAQTNLGFLTPEDVTARNPLPPTGPTAASTKQWIETAIAAPVRLSAADIDKAIKVAMRGVPKAIADSGLDMRGAMDQNMSALTRILGSQYVSQLHRAGITVGSSFANGIALSGANVRAAAESILKAAADGIRSKRSAIDDAIDQVNEDLKQKAITQTAEVTNLVTSMLSPALSKALSSPDKQVQADAKYLEQLLTDRLSEINLRPGIISDKTKALIENAKKSADPQIREFAKTFEDLYAQDLGKTADSPKVKDAGTDVGTTTAKSMVQGAIDWLGSATARQQLGDAWAAAVASVSSNLRVVAPPGGSGNPNWAGAASGGPAYADRPMWVGELGRPELFVPKTDGRILTESQAARLAAGGDRTQTFNIDHITVADANDEMSVIQRLRFMALAQGA